MHSLGEDGDLRYPRTVKSYLWCRVQCLGYRVQAEAHALVIEKRKKISDIPSIKQEMRTHKRLESSSSGNEQEDRPADEVGVDTKTTSCRFRIQG
jgi:hypothetical protein